MFTVGLTGGIGSGKSTVADLFAELGVPVIDTDLIAHQLTKPGGEALQAIREKFPDAAMRADGALDRAALRRIVFSDAAARRQLEAILHPRIRREVERRLNQLHAPYAIVVIPLLVQRQDRPQGAGRGCKADKSATTTHRPEGGHPEGHKRLAAYPLRVETGGYRDLLSRVLVVDCTEAQQIERTMARSLLSREEVVAILAAQVSREQRLAVADDVLTNMATPEALRTEVSMLHQRYLNCAAGHLP
ncbi:MAG: dephospho-CoA kinase [Thiobacillus sp.]|nr:dephospho-CoA kinase [Thiobacillus sp.]